MASNVHHETQNPIESTARELTTKAEHGQSISTELDAMSYSDKVKIAHQMETYNTADRAQDSHLPKLDVTFMHDPKGDLLDKITTVKDPDAIFFKGTDDIYKNQNLANEVITSFMDHLDPATKKEMARQDAEREKLVANLSPEQRKQYYKEEAAMDQWTDSMNRFFDPHHRIGFGEKAPAMPDTPLHSAIDTLVNGGNPGHGSNSPEHGLLSPTPISPIETGPLDPSWFGTGGIGLDRPTILGHGHDKPKSGVKEIDLFPHSDDPKIDAVLM